MADDQQKDVKSTIIWGPAGAGKTSTLKQTLEKLRKEVPTRTLIISYSTNEEALIAQRKIEDAAKALKLEIYVAAAPSEQEDSPVTNHADCIPASENVEDTQIKRMAKCFLRLLLDEKDRKVIVGDLLEKYERQIKRRGKKRATWWLYYEVARSVWPFLKQAIVKFSGQIVRTRRAE